MRAAFAEIVKSHWNEEMQRYNDCPNSRPNCAWCKAIRVVELRLSKEITLETTYDDSKDI